ncbi:PsiF family protein [Denitromonas ohlonensis]|uniref:Phosphate starvation-inducible protein PsiF n=2 Tax=Denitromonas TaxID=139331 RepID=A0A558CF37_9RHOO|nr:PsiF family protein [Denitromonas ohlonensis]TVT47381.1 MAG: hypothetical protein FHP94_14935 [Denitromonas halophila]TVO64950.1 hypothetical protein FHP90_11445 [Denitromonas ohlonensis]TVO75623.1 hypothetical protein FHP89_12805 [Denitromonas ohlonensis]TVT71733.1 MAG: hypothetical protein FHP93_09670 [Denitromonas halophila]TVT78717.1 MAG: hypothetical protein FHP92_00505 [Denitromonas halophila]
MTITKKIAIAASLAALLLQPLAGQANPQHDKMRNCNKTAKEKALKGEPRKAFMKTCLSGKATTPAPLAAAKPAKK